MSVSSQESQQNQTALWVLRKRVIGFIIIQIALVWMGYQILLAWWTSMFALRWMGIALISSIILLVAIWQNLEYNHPKGKQALQASFGAGNMLTILRGILICFLAGFLLREGDRSAS